MCFCRDTRDNTDIKYLKDNCSGCFSGWLREHLLPTAHRTPLTACNFPAHGLRRSACFELALEGFALDLQAAYLAVQPVELLGAAVDFEPQAR